jgi:molecular chaperone IbpA
LELLDQASDNAQGYPPYNIERRDENNYRITLAVAGFAEKELNIEVRDRVLTIEGKREEETKTSFLHQGIAGRSFQRHFQLAEHVEVKGAKLENGLLHVDLERIVPEERKPRRIAINAPELKTIEGSKVA